MLAEFIELGRICKSDKGIDNFIIAKDIYRKGKKDKKTGKVERLEKNILKIKFYEDRVVFDTNEPLNSDSFKKYTYIGTADGPNSLQWYVTDTKPKYLVTQVLPNYLAQLKNRDLRLNDEDVKEDEVINNNPKINILTNIIDKFYIRFDDFKNKNYRYILNFPMFLQLEDKIFKSEKDNNKIINNDTINNEEINSEEDNTDNNNIDIMKLYEEEKDKPNFLEKSFIEKLTKLFDKCIYDKFGIKADDIGLCTIYINDVAIASDEDYKQIILELKFNDDKIKEKTSKKESNINNCCHFCGSNNDVSTDLKKSKIKFYITQKLTFASYLKEKNFHKNLNICSDCLKNLLAAETYIKNNLSIRMGGFNCYLLPHFIYSRVNIDNKALDVTCKSLKSSINSLQTLESLEEAKSKLDINFDNESYFLFDLIFYEIIQNATKIQRVIYDTKPSVLKEIKKHFDITNNLMKMIFLNKEFMINLNAVYNLIPIKLSKGNPTEAKYILNLYDQIISKKQIDMINLIDRFVKGIGIIYFKQGSYNIQYSNLENYVIKTNMLIYFLNSLLNYKKEVEILDISDENIKEYVTNFNFDEQQQTLFLLGSLIGKIANAQYDRGKPILNKLNFNGIDTSKIIQLSNVVFEKLRQEKILKFNEILYSECKKYIDMNLKNWRLSKKENLYYILSGYSFETQMAINNAIEKKKNKDNNDNEINEKISENDNNEGEI